MKKRINLLRTGVILTLLLFMTLWLSAQPQNSAQKVFEEINEIRPETILLVPPEGQALNITGSEEGITAFFSGDTPGRLFLLGSDGEVMEISHLDGVWTVVKADGSQVAVDHKLFAEEFKKQMEEGRKSGRFVACQSNLKNIGTALEMYSTDWSGKYPPLDQGLNLLTPNYLKYIPECPAAGKVTYSYDGGPDAELNGPGFIDYYEVRCMGGNHKDVGLQGDLPMYTGIVGLISTDAELAEVLEDAMREKKQR